MKSLLLPLLFSTTALGDATCVNFTGKWLGKCTTFPTQEHELIIVQNECSFLTVRSDYNHQDVEVGATKNESSSSDLQTTYKVTYYEWHPDKQSLIMNIHGGGKRKKEPSPWVYQMTGFMELENNTLVYKTKNTFQGSNGGTQTTENSCEYVIK